MPYWVCLEDESQPVRCSYGTPLDRFVPEERGDEPCPRPCFPPLPVGHHDEGEPGDPGWASLDFPAGYDPHLRRVDTFGGSGLVSLEDKRGPDLAAPLEHALAVLGCARGDDPREGTPGNAGYALSILLRWAGQFPDAPLRVETYYRRVQRW